MFERLPREEVVATRAKTFFNEWFNIILMLFLSSFGEATVQIPLSVTVLKLDATTTVT